MSTYSFDKFMDAPDKSAQDQQADGTLEFVRDYSRQLRELEDALDGGAGAGEVWDSVRDPIGLAFQPQEPLPIAALVHTEHRILRKVVLVLAHVTWEMQHLAREGIRDLVPSLAMFGEAGAEHDVGDGEAQSMFGRSLNLLIRVRKWSRAAGQLAAHAVRQLGSLATSQSVGPLQTVLFMPVVRGLSELLGALVTTDTVIQHNDAWAAFCQVFQRTARRGLEDPTALGTDANGLERVFKTVEELDTTVLRPGALLQHALQHVLLAEPSLGVQANNAVCDILERALRTFHAELVSEIDTPTECGRREQLIGVCALFVLQVHLLGQVRPSKKTVRAMWDLQRRVPLMHVIGGTAATWSPGQFLLNMVPKVLSVVSRRPAREVEDGLRGALKQRDGALRREVQSLYLQLCVWMSRIESEFPVSTAGKEAVGIEGTLILQGLHLAHSIATLLRTTVSLHLYLDAPLHKNQVVLLCKCIEMLKAIEHTYHRKSAAFASLSAVIAEFLAFKIQSTLNTIRSRLQSRRKPTDLQIDQMNALSLSITLLKGTPSAKRLLLLRHSLAVALQGSTGRDAEAEEVETVLRRLELVSGFEDVLSKACHCGWLYWSQPLVHTFFEHVYEAPEKAPQLMYVFEALHDTSMLVRASVHVGDTESLVSTFRRDILCAFEQCIVQPLCQEVETDLRLHIHTAVLGNASTDLSRLSAGGGDSSKLKDLSIFFKIRPLRFFGTFVSVKQRVEHYLDTIFYNLTALNPSDWKTYEEMRGLALEKFGLELRDAYLPGQTLEQGLDVLEITRNIHIFVSRFAYNLNNNLFVERSDVATARNLNSISIRHVANSIRTHGTGIMNTSVNFVYQFLGRKFFIFSQFLYDDHIKSRLIKDIRFFRDRAASLDNKYPFRRAAKFTSGIRKLGLTDGGLSYLDQFRLLITEIGNALGYVRMVRAGGLSYIGDAIRFVPDISAIRPFAPNNNSNNNNNNTENNTENNQDLSAVQTAAARLSDASQGAGRSLDTVLGDLSRKFAEGSDYFRILEHVFRGEMQKDQNSHLRNFSIIVPPLTLSYVDHMMQGKDALHKKGKKANFTDDGFALGVAFILKILDQNQEFNSLHWFDSVTDHLSAELQQVEESMRAKARAKASEEEIQTMKLTTNKLRAQQREFNLLFYSFSGSRIFFRD